MTDWTTILVLKPVADDVRKKKNRQKDDRMFIIPCEPVHVWKST